MNKWSLARFATKFLGWNVSSFLISKKESESVSYIMVNEANPFLIPTYPRFIINNLSIEDRGHPMSRSYKPDMKDRNIFNSSDFTIINDAFGSSTPNQGKTLRVGEKFLFRGQEYIIENIKVTIADYFNDYSFTAFERGVRHEGKATPYNIIIHLDVKEDHNY